VTPPERLARVALTNSERIVERGTLHVTWFVRRARAWVAADRWPGARVEQLESGPGTVWESRIELDVPAGAELMRVESRPMRGERLSALEFLERERKRPPRRVRRTYYRVGSRGELRPSQVS
jgi:hypothetical protein